MSVGAILETVVVDTLQSRIKETKTIPDNRDDDVLPFTFQIKLSQLRLLISPLTRMTASKPTKRAGTPPALFVTITTGGLVHQIDPYRLDIGIELH